MFGKILANKLDEYEKALYPPLGKGELEALELAKQKKVN